MYVSDVATTMWKILTPYVVGSLVSCFTALVLWIIRTFNTHSKEVIDIKHILVGTDGKNGMRSKLDKCADDTDELKLDVARIKTTLKMG
jgi:hypothetical protein